MLAYLNGRYLPRDQIHISPDDRGFLLADGVYEVIRAYGGRLFKMSQHLERLARSMRELGISGLDVPALAQVAERLVSDNGLTAGDATVYLQVTRGAGGRSRPFPDPPIPPTVYGVATPFVPPVAQQQAGVKITLLPDIRWARCDIKSIALLPSVLAGQRARELGVEEAVFVRDGAITEGTHTNFAAVFDGTLVTPPRSQYILAGITRQTILDLCHTLQIPFDEAPILEHSLGRAQECMVLSTMLEVMPVVDIDGRPVADGRPGPVTRKLQQAFIELTRPEDWAPAEERLGKQRDYSGLLANLAAAYAGHSPKSAAVNQRARQVLVDGGSHTLRLIQPFPPRIVSARGAWVRDEDGHDILDLWQGHLANVLGHNPPVVTEALAAAFADGFGLQTGLVDRLQVEAAELLCARTGAERVRFTTSGSLATMYAILLARAYTGRDVVFKVGGGWHGAQPWGLKGVGYHPGDNGYHKVESAGLPPAVTDQVVVTRFNDPEMLSDHFREVGDRVACFIVEPFLGAGGLIPATQEYLRVARELTLRHGAVLIFDEVISGFRFRAGDAGALYGILPDLATFGKVMGGGMPVAAVGGRAEIMNLAGREGSSKVKFSGGTYSGHPASLLAAKTMMSYLVAHENEVYPRLAELGALARRTVEEAFHGERIFARCTGDGSDVLRGSSMLIVLFPLNSDLPLDRPECLHNPGMCDVMLSQRVLELALLLEDVHMLRGHGAVSTAHTEADIQVLGQACAKAARLIRPYL